MKQFFKYFIITGLPFGLFMGVMYTLWRDLTFGIFAGLFSMVFFGGAMGAFHVYQHQKAKKNQPEIIKVQQLIKDDAANYFKGVQAIGGWLYLTTESLIFKSHKFNIQNKEVIIPLNHITNIKPVKTLFFFPNGFEISTKDNEKHKFVVNKRQIWIKMISNEKRVLL